MTIAIKPDTDEKRLVRRTWPRYIPMALLALFFMFPIVFMFVSAFKTDAAIFADLRSLRAFLPIGELTFANFAGVFDRVPVIRFLFNSIFITTAIVGLGLIVNSMCGFALSRMKWRGQKIVFSIIIATLIVPFETVAIPLVYWVAKLPSVEFNGLMPTYSQGWLNTYHVQILPFVANAFFIFLFAQYFKSIPRELDEAARVDGASWFQIYWKLIVPLSGPVFATAAILTFVSSPGAWNAYLWPLMVAQQEELRPVMVGMQYFFQLDTAWGEIMAYTSLITLPVLILFLCFQRAFVNSIASTGMKG
ncbi:carbohydrate ABC transporter permease [Hoyosella sp. YIM 151337]|uniref:carbohydrate ABC transporter permease n=1 Tax=Hoyosella sp. YIM 151337 TaxID=2992742 RepID=UPI0022365703|nr:carbohydrate ABC transporter permease [Hoyosella sp. YIM 151337]MCW4353809.1 carbohydrate ABC transporter permease [Hoyosella sp. YIM 151337]